MSEVTCRICGMNRKRLAAHLKAAHEMSVEAYKTEYPDALVESPTSRRRSPECRAKQAAAARRRWSNPNERDAQSERLKKSAPWKGKRLSEEHRRAIGDGGRGVRHDLSEDRRREVLRNVRLAPDYSSKLSVALRLRMEREGDGFGLRRSEVQRKSLESRIRNGTLIPPKGGRGITGFRKGITHYCRSTLEANFARILIHEGVSYEYEPQVFTLPSGSRWTPDFRLLQPLGDKVPAGWVEMKGWRMKDGSFQGGASVKIAAFEQMTGEKVFVLCQDSDLWRQIEAMYAAAIPWERPGYNRKTHPKVFGRRAA